MLTQFRLVQQLAVKIAQAADCRDFTRSRREEEDSRAARKKRKQVAWGCVTLCPFMSMATFQFLPVSIYGGRGQSFFRKRKDV